MTFFLRSKVATHIVYGPHMAKIGKTEICEIHSFQDQAAKRNRASIYLQITTLFCLINQEFAKIAAKNAVKK